MLQAKRGGLKDTPADDLLAAVLQGVLSQTGINPAVRASSRILSGAAYVWQLYNKTLLAAT